jgi:hypothetical protein
MAAWQHQYQLIVAKHPSRQPGDIGPLDKHADVGPSLAQRGHHGLRHLFLQIHAQQRMQLGIARQQRRQELVDRRGAGAQPDVAGDALRRSASSAPT